MGVAYDSTFCKQQILKLLLSNKNFIKLINPKPSDCEDIDIIDVLRGGEWIVDGETKKEQGHVFDYDFVGQTTLKDRTFCFVESTIRSIRQNTFVDMDVFICVFTPKESVRITDKTSPTVQEVKNMGCVVGNDANRIDALCTVIDDVLYHNSDIVGITDIERAAYEFIQVYTPQVDYWGKRLHYQVTALNGGDQCEN